MSNNQSPTQEEMEAAIRRVYPYFRMVESDISGDFIVSSSKFHNWNPVTQRYYDWISEWFDTEQAAIADAYSKLPEGATQGEGVAGPTGIEFGTRYWPTEEEAWQDVLDHRRGKQPTKYLSAPQPASPGGEEVGKPISQGLCDTTSTERFENKDCVCATYPGNLGPCMKFVEGGNTRCAFCDHELYCHLAIGKQYVDSVVGTTPPSEVREGQGKCNNCGKHWSKHVEGISGIRGCHNNSSSTVFEPIPASVVEKVGKEMIDPIERAHERQVNESLTDDEWIRQAATRENGCNVNIGSPSPSQERADYAAARRYPKAASVVGGIEGEDEGVEKFVHELIAENQTKGLRVVKLLMEVSDLKSAWKRIKSSLNEVFSPLCHCPMCKKYREIVLLVGDRKPTAEEIRTGMEIESKLPNPSVVGTTAADDGRYENWLIERWPDEEDRRHESHVHGSNMRMAWDAALQLKSGMEGTESSGFKRIPSGPVCCRGGLTGLPCEGSLYLRRDGPLKGSWACDKHYEYPELKPALAAAPETKVPRMDGEETE